MLLTRKIKQYLVPILLLYLGFSGFVFFGYRFGISEELIFLSFSIASLIIGIGIFLFRYLQSSNIKKDSQDIKLEDVLYKIEELRHNTLTKNDIQNFYDIIKNIESNIKYKENNLGLDTEQKKEILDFLRKDISKIMSGQFLTAIDEKYAPAIVRKHEFTRLLEDFSLLIERLTLEITSLTKRANINLIFGSLMTIVAMGSLAYFVFGSSVNYKDIIDLLSYYIPRIAFIIFIEVFAYFFLKLYKSNLEDIKYYQNELTNIQSKIIALKSGMLLEDDSAIKSIIQSLSKTERNFILKKGESTVDIEKSKLDVEQFKEVLNFGRTLSKIKK